MMRDRGFNFYWKDRYASNDYARGFEYDPNIRYGFLTAFEVLEHLVDPISELESMMQLSPNVFVSTMPVPEPAPAISDWWYLTPSTGQHVSLYTQRTLQAIAKHFNRSLLTFDSYHLFTAETHSRSFFRLAMNLRFAKALNRIHRRSSLIGTDYETLAGKPIL
jgi:hypothetical protein